MRERYKKTEVGEIPEDWEVKKLEEVVELIDGDRSSNYPSQSDLVNEGIVFLSTSNIKNNKLVYKECRFITKEKFNKLRKGKLQNKDLIITLRGSIGNVAKFSDKEYKTGFINAQMMILRGNKINSDYLLNLLISEKYQIKINIMSSGSAQPQLTKKDLSSLKLIVPPLKEQEKIAEILLTLDCQIDDTDKLIEKIKELKKGLMQKLLTKGIGHKEFKKTEIGEIPVEWEVKKVSDLVKVLKSGLSRSLKDENIGIPCLRSNNIKSDKLVLDDLKYWYSVDDKGANIEDYILEVGDIIINFINSVSQIGKGCVFDKENFRTIYTTNLLRVKVDDKKIINRFFNYYMQTARYKKDISLITKPAVNQASFTTVEYKAIKFPVPKLTEQKRIVDILSSVDSEIEEYENKKSKLEYLKKGLMQQLFTGKIRVI